MFGDIVNPDQAHSAPRPRSSPGGDQPRRVSLDPFANLVRSWRDARAAAGRARADVDRIEGELLELLGDAEVGTLDGTPAVLRETEERDGIDIGRLRRDHPELWEQYPLARRRTHLKFPRQRRTAP
ncbi:hypothetical protein AB5J62_33770 [Amycolatopsis sp. cg5]|uniref:hypothetical protein n=1 Tax=Amycolatopsis sp. cg5 TaxID=3238802 RepID=UPI00352679FF